VAASIAWKYSVLSLPRLRWEQFRAVEFRAIQRDQYTPVQTPHGIQAAALIQFGREIGEHGMELAGFDRIELRANLAVAGNLTHAKQRLAVRTAQAGLQMPLVRQE
jgi:hypothetical protein